MYDRNCGGCMVLICDLFVIIDIYFYHVLAEAGYVVFVWILEIMFLGFREKQKSNLFF